MEGSEKLGNHLSLERIITKTNDLEFIASLREDFEEHSKKINKANVICLDSSDN